MIDFLYLAKPLSTNGKMGAWIVADFCDSSIATTSNSEKKSTKFAQCDTATLRLTAALYT